MAGFLELQNVAKSFGEARVLDGVCLTVEEGETLALLGPSGSGKTTILRLLAGFEAPDSGSIHVGSQDIVPLRPADRGFGMVFQHYALFPHLTVGENVAFGLESQGHPSGDIASRVAEVLGLVDLAGFEPRRVSRISGGQQQRVALARALAPKPRLLLLDEPLSNLDPTLRERTRRELRAAIQKVGITTVLVTHEQDEAFHVGDRVALLNDGHLEQVGQGEELYDHPASRFVATFVGRASVLEGRVESEDSVRLALGPLWPVEGAAEFEQGARVDIVVRPESLRVVNAEDSGVVAGEVIERRYAGHLTFLNVRTEDGGELEIASDAAKEGDRVGVSLKGEGPPPLLFAAEGTGARG